MKQLAGAIGAALLAGCGSLNPFESSGPRPGPLPQLSSQQAVRVLWTASVGSADRFSFAPALAGGSVYAAARDGTVMRIDAANGQTQWRASAEVRLSGGVGADAETVVVASEEGEVVALDAGNGKIKWRARVSAPAATGRPAPTIAKVGINPTSISPMCIDPPSPPVHPMTRPQISPKTPSGLIPRESATPCPLYVQVTMSVARVAAAIPTHTAS